MSNELTLINRESWGALREQSTDLVKSGFLKPSVKTPEQAMAIILKGSELGLPAMASLALIDVVQGVPVVEGQGMLALIFSKVPGAVVNFLERSDKICRIEAQRPGGKLTAFSFSMEDAKLAELHTKDNWKKRPRVMLQWRCVAEMAKVIFPDVLAGLYLDEEIKSETIDVTPGKEEDKGKSLQALLSEPEPPKQTVTIEEIDDMFKAFEALNFPREAVLEGVLCSDPTKLTQADMVQLRKWYAEEREKAKKAEQQ